MYRNAFTTEEIVAPVAFQTVDEKFGAEKIADHMFAKHLDDNCNNLGLN
ncbi:MAG TPA: hypothetical protein VFM79_05560 [Pelobium sp.]|nr:hypothetical protein [Pelobium sp.]